jgi:hypothetical protein
VPSPSFAAHVLTCPDRRGSTVQTVANFAASDWGEAPHIHVELGEGPPSRERIAAAYGHMLTMAAAAGVDYTLLLEDEIAVNRHLRHNLRVWEPVERGELMLGSLASAEIAHLPGYRSEDGDEHSFVAETRTVLGGQALIVSRRFLTYAAAHWGDAGVGQSRRLVRLAAEYGRMHYHVPSLVLHLGADRLWGTQLHGALDFDADWRAS